MFKMLGAAVVAISMSTAAPAGAAVLYQAGGTAHDQELILDRSEWIDLLAEHGQIDIAVNWTLDPGEVASGSLNYISYRKYLNGYEEPVRYDASFMPGSGGMRSWQWSATDSGFLLRLTFMGDYHCQDWQAGSTCWWDELRYLWAGVGGGYDVYDLTISSIDGGSAVPEPATWLMLIAGFGLVGATARRARNKQSISAA